MIDDQSPAGSWANALRYPHSIKVFEHPGEALHTLPSPGTYGAADAHVLAAPVLSIRSPFHEAHNA